MPLAPGTSREVIGQNIAELLRTRRARGGAMRFGDRLKQVSNEKARQIAAAIAYRRAGKST